MVTLSFQTPTPLRPRMEHRWGARLDVDLPIRLESGARTGDAVICNLSISGARIACHTATPLLAAVVVVIPPAAGRPRELRLAGRVVRREPGVIAVEWEDMACRPLLALLRQMGGAMNPLERDRAFA